MKIKDTGVDSFSSFFHTASEKKKKIAFYQGRRKSK